MRALKLARESGIKVGILRLITAWPFPAKKISELSQQVKRIIVPEVNYGQMVHMVKEHAECEVVLLSHPGGGIHRPKDILKAIKEAKK